MNGKAMRNGLDTKQLEQETLERLCGIIREYNFNIKNQLEVIVANLCNVDVKEMMEDTKHLYNSQARWLYWYAYRYLTNEPYSSIINSTRYGRDFTVGCVCNSLNKMSTLINSNTIWTKRWTILKGMIKEYILQKCDNNNLTASDITIKVTTPKGVNIELKHE